MDMSLVPVARYETGPEAHLALGRLHDADIPAVLGDEHLTDMFWHLSRGIGGVSVLVNREDVQRASGILAIEDDIGEGIPEEVDDGLTRCPACGSTEVTRRLRFANWVLAVLVLFYIPLLFGRRWRCDTCGWSGKTRDLERA